MRERQSGKSSAHTSYIPMCYAMFRGNVATYLVCCVLWLTLVARHLCLI